jgi:hypothetical protein
MTLLQIVGCVCIHSNQHTPFRRDLAYAVIVAVADVSVSTGIQGYTLWVRKRGAGARSIRP